MNLLKHETKMKLFNEHQQRPSSSNGGRWNPNIQDMGKRTINQQLASLGSENQSHGSRLAKKLINIHQSCDTQNNTISSMITQSHDLQKRIALEDCTNFLQQKTISQYPHSSKGLHHILNSNRSGSSTGFLTSKAGIGLNGLPPSTVQSFKFNLTLNRNNKNYSNQRSIDYQDYPDQVAEQQIEDSEAVLVPPRNARGHSQSSKQHMFKLVKTFDDTDQSKFADEPTMQKTIEQRGLSKEWEERQTIFEEEIIKRIQEIQKYTKSLHAMIKKVQKTSGKDKDDWAEIQSRINEFKDTVGLGQVSEDQVSEMIEERLMRHENERQLIFESLESKMLKDFDQKLKGVLSQTGTQIQQAKEEVIQVVSEDLIPEHKREMAKVSQDKAKEVQRALDKQIFEIQDKLEELEQIRASQDSLQRDLNSKFDKVTKQLRDDKTELETSIITLGDELANKVFQTKKQTIKDLKAEFDFSQFITETDMRDQVNQIHAKIESIHLSSSSKSNDEVVLERIRGQELLIDSLKSDIEALTIQSRTKLETHQESLASLDSKIDTQIPSLQSQLEDFKYEVEQNLQSLSNDLKSQPQAHDEGLEERISTQVKQVSDQTKEQLEHQRQQLNQRALRSEVQEIKQELDDRIKSLKQKLKQAKEFDANYASQQSVSELNENLQTRVGTIEAQLELKVQPVSYNDSEIQEALAKMKSELGILKSCTDSEMEQLRLRITELSKPAEIQVIAPHDNSDDFKTLEYSLAQVSEQLDNLKQEVDEATENQASTTNSLKEQIEQLAQLFAQDAAKEGKSEQSDFERATQAIKDEVKSIQDSVKSLRSEFQTAGINALSRAEVEDLQELVANIKKGLQSQQNTESQAIRGAISEISAEITALRDQMSNDNGHEQLKADINALKLKQVDTLDLITENSEQLASVTQSLDGMNVDLENLKTEVLIRLQSTSDELKEAPESILKSVKDTYDNQITSLTEQLDAQSQKNAQLTLEIANMCAQIAQLSEAPAQVAATAKPSKPIQVYETFHEDNHSLLELKSHRSHRISQTGLLNVNLDCSKVSKHEAQQHFLEDFSDAEIDQTYQDQLSKEDDEMFNNKSSSMGNNSFVSNRLMSMISPVNPSDNVQKHQFHFQEDRKSSEKKDSSIDQVQELSSMENELQVQTLSDQSPEQFEEQPVVSDDQDNVQVQAMSSESPQKVVEFVSAPEEQVQSAQKPLVSEEVYEEAFEPEEEVMKETSFDQVEELLAQSTGEKEDVEEPGQLLIEWVLKCELEQCMDEVEILKNREFY